MPERLIDALTEYLAMAQGKDVSLRDIRDYLKIETGSNEDKNLRVQMSTTLVKNKIVKPSGKNDGYYKVVVPVKPVFVSGRERKPPLDIFFPRDFETMQEFDFVNDIVLRGGDLILISGQSNFGKTCLCMNWCAENLAVNPILMGNEYTTLDNEPSPRFLSRLDNMDWIEWANGTGDKFTLLPVRDDYAEHIEKDRINIIDWINLDAGSLFMISRTMEDIKRQLGDGLGIIAIQKSEGANAGRGGQFTRDFADLEILLDNFGIDEVKLTLGKVKESKARLLGKSYAFSIQQGVKIVNFRELKKCPSCYGSGRTKGGECFACFGKGMVDK